MQTYVSSVVKFGLMWSDAVISHILMLGVCVLYWSQLTSQTVFLQVWCIGKQHNILTAKFIIIIIIIIFLPSVACDRLVADVVIVCGWYGCGRYGLPPCKYRKTSDRSPRLLSVQLTLTPGLYPEPGVYAGPGFYQYMPSPSHQFSVDCPPKAILMAATV